MGQERRAALTRAPSAESSEHDKRRRRTHKVQHRSPHRARSLSGRNVGARSLSGRRVPEGKRREGSKGASGDGLALMSRSRSAPPERKRGSKHERAGRDEVLDQNRAGGKLQRSARVTLRKGPGEDRSRSQDRLRDQRVHEDATRDQEEKKSKKVKVRPSRVQQDDEQVIHQGRRDKGVARSSSPPRARKNRNGILNQRGDSSPEGDRHPSNGLKLKSTKAADMSGNHEKTKEKKLRRRSSSGSREKGEDRPSNRNRKEAVVAGDCHRRKDRETQEVNEQMCEEKKDSTQKKRKTIQPKGLPEGWRAAEDARGKMYYWNKATKETTWTFPGEQALPAKDGEPKKSQIIDKEEEGKVVKQSKKIDKECEPEKQSRKVEKPIGYGYREVLGRKDRSPLDRRKEEPRKKNDSLNSPPAERNEKSGKRKVCLEGSSDSPRAEKGPGQRVARGRGLQGTRKESPAVTLRKRRNDIIDIDDDEAPLKKKSRIDLESRMRSDRDGRRQRDRSDSRPARSGHAAERPIRRDRSARRGRSRSGKRSPSLRRSPRSQRGRNRRSASRSPPRGTRFRGRGSRMSRSPPPRRLNIRGRGHLDRGSRGLDRDRGTRDFDRDRREGWQGGGRLGKGSRTSIRDVGEGRQKGLKGKGSGKLGKGGRLTFEPPFPGQNGVFSATKPVGASRIPGGLFPQQRFGSLMAMPTPKKGAGKALLGKGAGKTRISSMALKVSKNINEMASGPPPEDGKYEAPRQTIGLKLIGENFDTNSPGSTLKWNYLLVDNSRRCFAGLLQPDISPQQLRKFEIAVRDGTRWDQPLNAMGFPIPRKTAWMVSSQCHCTYRYGGLEVDPEEFPDWMTEIMEIYMPLCGITSREEWPNSCNLNLYEDGGHAVGWHADDEKLFMGTVSDIQIISLSFGQSRNFEVRVNQPEDGERALFRFRLNAGDLMTMEGMLQKYYQHRVPKEHTARLPRINLTWRWIKAHNPNCPKGRMMGRPALLPR